MDLFGFDWKSLWGADLPTESVGVVYTRPHIVEFILDLVGYDSKVQDLLSLHALEPSCGDGAFTTALIQRLLRAAHGKGPLSVSLLRGCISAADISLPAVEASRSNVAEVLRAAGCSSRVASELATRWIHHADFLLHPWKQQFDVIVGNPPYVRIEDLPRRVLSAYRQSLETFGERSDLYVAFFERSLELLKQNGRLGFICANRWTKNKYGEALRRAVAEKYSVTTYLNLEHTQPFERDVAAYPAIFVIAATPGKPTHAATLNDVDAETLADVRKDIVGKRRVPRKTSLFRRWYASGEPWVATSTEELASLKRLERLPVLEKSADGTRVGIGVATGADSVFVVSDHPKGVEPDRLLPLAMASDVRLGQLDWTGKYLVNPYAQSDDGSLVDLSDYPGLRAYFNEHRDRLTNRHVGKKNPSAWYKTIDRVWPTLQLEQKLLLPDIQRGGVVVLDRGAYYPHHNLYWITSTSWPLRALQTLLKSQIVLEQMRAHSVQMRGGSLRYQAQALRRLRLPRLMDLDIGTLQNLEELATNGPQAEVDAVANEAFSESIEVLA